ncbi:putative reverse transcriptase domain-containing protein, partial [Tanacetum coccineum]
PRTKTKLENDQQDDNVETNHDNGNGNGNRNGNSNGNGNRNPNVNNKGVVPVVQECTYQDFVKCQPLNFKGTKGVISSEVDAACAMTWKALMRLMTEVYCPRNEIQKMETELWNLTEDKAEKYIGGLPDNIQSNVIVVEPTRLQDAIRVANNLMDQKLKGYAIKNAENKRRAYTVKNNVERKGYVRTLPYYSKCRLHHEGPCAVNCGNCKGVGHMTRDCRIAVAATPQRAPDGNQMGNTCYECGRPRNYRNECPKLRNQNHGNKTRNKTGNNEAKERAYAIGGGGANLDSNVIM